MVAAERTKAALAARLASRLKAAPPGERPPAVGAPRVPVEFRGQGAFPLVVTGRGAVAGPAEWGRAPRAESAGSPWPVEGRQGAWLAVGERGAPQAAPVQAPEAGGEPEDRSRAVGARAPAGPTQAAVEAGAAALR